MEADKKKALDLALKQIDKVFGKGSIVRLGDVEIEPIDAVSTGSLGLDLALGVGGIPKGRIIEIYGPESSGKTTLTLHIIAECQKAGGTCAFVDAEHALDVKYASNLGVDTDNLYVSQPDPHHIHRRAGFNRQNIGIVLQHNVVPGHDLRRRQDVLSRQYLDVLRLNIAVNGLCRAFQPQQTAALGFPGP